MSISEIKERIEKDELGDENIEIISNDELFYGYSETSFFEFKEVNIWKNENLALAA